MPNDNFLSDVSHVGYITHKGFLLFPLAPETMNAAIGEWLELNNHGQLVRGTTRTWNNMQTEEDESTTEGDNPDVFMVTGVLQDAQAKVAETPAYQYMASTALFVRKGLVPGAPLTVQSMIVNGIHRRGLGLAQDTSGMAIVGYVRAVDDDRLHFMHMGVQQIFEPSENGTGKLIRFYQGL